MEKKQRSIWKLKMPWPRSPLVSDMTPIRNNIGPGEPDPDSPGASCMSGDDAPDPNLAGNDDGENESNDSNCVLGNAGPNPNRPPDDHAMMERPPHVKLERPRYNLCPRDPTAVIPRVWDNYKSDTQQRFSTGATMWDIVHMMEEVGLLPTPCSPSVHPPDADWHSMAAEAELDWPDII